jgi:hypothetical protein
MTAGQTLYQERAIAVRRLVDQARAIEKGGVTYASLDRIGGLLARLARRADLLRQAEFPLGADGGIYRLSEDPDHRFALHASAGGPGKKVPPHNHTTWAVIAGVHGAERNVVYERLDNGARADFVQLHEAPAKEDARTATIPTAGRLPPHKTLAELGGLHPLLLASASTTTRSPQRRHGKQHSQAL